MLTPCLKVPEVHDLFNSRFQEVVYKLPENYM